MYAPSDDFVDAYLEIQKDSRVPKPYKQAFLDYVDQNLRAEQAVQKGFTNRFMMLLFQGRGARKALRSVVGPPTAQTIGNTVRGTYGDCLMQNGEIEYFEPAVLTAPDDKTNRRTLELLADYAEVDGGVLEDVVPYPPGAEPETTLVMLKPDNFFKPSSRPGNIIDMFSKTGLTIVGARLFSMSVAQGQEFYGFLEEVFCKKLKVLVEKTLRERLAEAFAFPIDEDEIGAMAEVLKAKNAHHEVCRIIEFMTGHHPDQTSPAERERAGHTKCLALLYQGENAIELIRDKLGPTDPKKAAGGTVRSDYGTDLMVNGAHASDSLASAARERPIVGLAGGEASDEKARIEAYLETE
jgi:nucleoside diphosphate kinase